MKKEDAGMVDGKRSLRKAYIGWGSSSMSRIRNQQEWVSWYKIRSGLVCSDQTQLVKAPIVPKYISLKLSALS